MGRNVLNQEEGCWCHLPTEVKRTHGWGVGLLPGGGCTHLSTWETDSSDILNCRHTNSPVTLLPVTAKECWPWDYFKLPTGAEEGGFAFALSLRLAISWCVFVLSRTEAA